MQETEIEILKIREEFLKEAKNSPSLLNDLANMEKYISESYQGRSLIELLQNADDCDSTKFYIKRLDKNLFLVANNGRLFNENDLISLCRSGASTKNRKLGTIGFRGIGFKSVVNYANEVYLYSGNYFLKFSKMMTLKELNVDINVPLIRIPHIDKDLKYVKEFESLKTLGYNTMFIFESNDETLIDEIEGFDNNCLLFLKNVSEIMFEYNKNKDIKIKRNSGICKLYSNKDISEWLVLNKNFNDISIAFKLENDKAVSLDGTYIHSFMPTNEKIDIPFIINGDFTTDPSRTKVIIDTDTNKTIVEVMRVVSKKIKEIILSEEDKYGLINVLSNFKKDNLDFLNPNSIKNKLYEEFINQLKLNLIEIADFSKIKVQPKWLEINDFKNYCNMNKYFTIITKGEKAILGIDILLEKINEINFDINDYLSYLSENSTSLNSRINLIEVLIAKYRYSFNEEIKKLILDAYLFDFNNKLVKTKLILNENIIEDSFFKNLNKTSRDPHDLNLFLKQIGFNITNNILNNQNDNLPTNNHNNISNNQNDNLPTNNYNNILKSQSTDLVLNNYNNIFIKDDSLSKKETVMKNNISGEKINTLQHILSKKTTNNTEPPEINFKKSINPKKWRSVEINVKEILESFEDVENVQDVSKINTGYDLLVEYENGTKKYVEIKSVKKIGEEFSLTSNEYATAQDSEYKDDYLLIICAQNEEEIELCIIDSENFKNIQFIRRTVKYEWACDSSYTGKYLRFGLNDF